MYETARCMIAGSPVLVFACLFLFRFLNVSIFSFPFFLHTFCRLLRYCSTFPVATSFLATTNRFCYSVSNLPKQWCARTPTRTSTFKTHKYTSFERFNNLTFLFCLRLLEFTCSLRIFYELEIAATGPERRKFSHQIHRNRYKFLLNLPVAISGALELYVPNPWAFGNVMRSPCFSASPPLYLDHVITAEYSSYGLKIMFQHNRCMDSSSVCKWFVVLWDLCRVW